MQVEVVLPSGEVERFPNATARVVLDDGGMEVWYRNDGYSTPQYQFFPGGEWVMYQVKASRS